MNGFLNILKPPGMTSAAVVARARRWTGEKRVGHAGTLDPDAAGVLPIMIGRSARLFDVLVDKRKTYVAEVAFGQSTDTQDAAGTVLETGENYPDLRAVEAAAEKLVGDIWQVPSVFSAIKKDGKRLYELAHAGQTAEVPPRLVHVESIRVHRGLPNHGFLMTVVCGRGTYIRSICNDLGKLCGCPAHMRFLLRAQSGAFDLSTAMTLEEAEKLAAEGRLAAALIPPDAPISHLPRVDAPTACAKQVMNGASFPADPAVENGATARIYLNGAFWGIAVRQDTNMIWRAQMPPETGGA